MNVELGSVLATDGVAIAEKWLHEGYDWQLNVAGFRCFRHDREVGRIGGGVMLLIRETVIVALEGLSTEVIWVELRKKEAANTPMGFHSNNKDRRTDM